MKVLVADANALIRCGLKHLIMEQDKKATVLEAESYDEAEEIDDEDIDLLWLDLQLPGMERFAGLETLRERFPEVPIAVTSASLANRRDVLRAIELGAQGIVPERAPCNDILDNLKRIKDGEIVVPKELLARTERQTHHFRANVENRDALTRRIAALTGRQREVLELLGQGKTNAEIAHALGITEHTARLHVSATLKTLEVSNRTQAALLAMA